MNTVKCVMREIRQKTHERDPGETTVNVEYFYADNFHLTVLKNEESVKALIPTILSVMKADAIDTLDDTLQLGSILL